MVQDGIPKAQPEKIMPLHARLVGLSGTTASILNHFCVVMDIEERKERG